MKRWQVMKWFAKSCGAAALAATVQVTGAADSIATTTWVTNSIGQQVFIAKFAGLHHPDIMPIIPECILTFKRLADGTLFRKSVECGSRLSKALGLQMGWFSKAEHQRRIATAIATGPSVVLLTEDISAKVAAFEEEEKGTNAPSPSPRGSGAVARKSLNCVYGCFVIDQFARSASISFASTARAYVTNAISQELFIAELTKVEPILKSGEPYWAMTFKRLADGREIRYVAWPKDPLIQRMRKLSPKQASEDRIERQLSGLRVLFMTEPSAVDVGVHVTNFLFLPDEQVINKTLVLSDDRQSETKP